MLQISTINFIPLFCRQTTNYDIDSNFNFTGPPKWAKTLFLKNQHCRIGAKLSGITADFTVVIWSHRGHIAVIVSVISLELIDCIADFSDVDGNLPVSRTKTSYFPKAYLKTT